MNEMQQFKEQGFTVFRNLIDESHVDSLKSEVIKKIYVYADKLEVNFSKYTFCTGRWLLNDNSIGPIEAIEKKLSDIIANELGTQISIKKRNITCKNKFITNEVPLHQDISYSPSDPYDFTTWIALNDVPLGSGELIFVPTSQNFNIEPAIDFWSPDFHDKNKDKFKNSIVNIHLRKGDVVMFDSRLWHGSNKNLNQQDRYAYVVRWKYEDTRTPDLVIPNPIPSEFGMWTCYTETKKILSQIQNKASTDLNNLITGAISHLDTTKNMQFDKTKAIIDLKNLAVLHNAANTQNAGDLCGIIYKNLWYSLLRWVCSDKCNGMDSSDIQSKI